MVDPIQYDFPMKQTLAALVCATLPITASAHPHVFVDAGISFLFNKEGALSAVKVEWAYDDLYSMLQLDDMGLDTDGDGRITVKEQEKLVGFDMQWIDGFEGDLYVTFGGSKIELGAPQKTTAKLSNGRLYSSHVRMLKKPLKMTDGAIALKVYDPTFYTAYTLDLGAQVINRQGCVMEQIPADLGKAYDIVENFLQSSSPDDQYPKVGENFADTLTLSCETSS